MVHRMFIDKTHRGFGLVEILVGLAIGLLTTLVIMQVFSVFERDKRATTGTADAQVNGSVALYSISRDLQQAGFGMMPTDKKGTSPIECNPAPTIDDGNLQTPIITSNNRIPFDLAPVVVTDGGTAAGASDTISIRYGSSFAGGAPSVIKAVLGTTVSVDNNLGCRVCELAVVFNETGTACTAGVVIGPHATTKKCPDDQNDPPPFSDTVSIQFQDIAATETATVVPGSSIACLGRRSTQVYAVANGTLTLNGAPLVSGIVNLQAQYGISTTSGDNKITQWVNATAGTDNWAAPTVAMRNRIKAVRVAIVARNSELEKDAVTSACSSTTDANPTGLCSWAGSAASAAPAIDLSNDPDWAKYRYRVFETIIPLRNVIWSYEAL